jgi:hypothetical protein
MTTDHIVVVGAGAAGLVAAGRAAELGARVLVLEKMEEAGKKILVSGKGRCNVTNSAPLKLFLEHYGRNGAFLRNAFYRFFREELLELFAGYGVETREERGGRIFPRTGEAADVRDALVRYAADRGARIRYRAAVGEMEVRDGVATGVRLRAGDRVPASRVILATGGASWTATGSTGDGYRMALDVGHTVEQLRPALVPLVVEEKARAKELQGISLRNVTCTFLEVKPSGKERTLRVPYPLPPTGEMLFTHFGVSGPLILTASLGAVDALRSGKNVWLSIDLKPGMTREEVRERLQGEFQAHPHRHLANLLRGWVPGGLADVLASASRFPDDQPVHSVRAEEREELVSLIKDFRWHITGSLPLEAGMVTAGGVSLKEVDPVTFASRVVEGLYLAGEVLDIAADTGGFNLQAAFTGGYLAGEAAAGSL